MKRLATFLAIGLLMFSMPMTAHATGSLDDVINDQGNSSVSQEYENDGGGSAEGSGGSGAGQSTVGDITDGEVGNKEYIDHIKDATDLDTPSEGATKVNEGIKKVASFVVQILAYAATALLVVRVLLDIIYITLPFTRSFLSNGYAGNAQAGGAGMPGQPGMGGMGMGGMGGMGMGGMGSMGGMGMGGMHSRYGGMGGMGAMGGMGGMQNGMSQPGASPALGRIQWVSTAALNAAAAEAGGVGPDGKPISPLKLYAKDMFIILILAPIFLVLAVSGALTELGFLIGELLAKALSSAGGMI